MVDDLRLPLHDRHQRLADGCLHPRRRAHLDGLLRPARGDQQLDQLPDRHRRPPRQRELGDRRELGHLDGGLVHVAGCTDTEIVAGYTLVDPRTIAPIRKGSQSYKFHAIEPDPDIPNRYFQTTDHFYPEDYRTFPGWERVVASMTADKFISVLEKILP